MTETRVAAVELQSTEGTLDTPTASKSVLTKVVGHSARELSIAEKPAVLAAYAKPLRAASSP